jgi:enoyl-CoA hydratase/carnithine racemase
MIEVVYQGPIAIVTLRHPRANAMNLELTDEIASVGNSCMSTISPTPAFI